MRALPTFEQRSLSAIPGHAVRARVLERSRHRQAPSLRVLVGAFALALLGCKTESPAGTVVADWTFASTDADPRPTPVSMSPPRVVTSDAEWPVARGPAVKLRFETEIGDYRGADGVHWNWPRHVHVTLASPTAAKLPVVQCMPAPPGNKIVGDKLVHPVGKDGVTPTGMVGCFFTTSEGGDYVFNINGDGEVARETVKH